MRLKNLDYGGGASGCDYDWRLEPIREQYRLKGGKMEEIATCKSCGSQTWVIYFDRIECSECKKSYSWPICCTDVEATKAQDIIRLVNDNH